MKVYIKIDKAVIKSGDIEIKKHKFHQHKSPISIENIDINEIVVSNKVTFRKKGFRYFIVYKDAKKFVLYAYFFQKCVHTEETLMKLNICLFHKR